MARKLGDAVIIIDSANGKTLDGIIKRLDGAEVHVYVPRFDTVMVFVGGITNRGRFRLKGV